MLNVVYSLSCSQSSGLLANGSCLFCEQYYSHQVNGKCVCDEAIQQWNNTDGLCYCKNKTFEILYGKCAVCSSAAVSTDGRTCVCKNGRERKGDGEDQCNMLTNMTIIIIAIIVAVVAIFATVIGCCCCKIKKQKKWDQQYKADQEAYTAKMTHLAVANPELYDKLRKEEMEKKRRDQMQSKQWQEEENYRNEQKRIKKEQERKEYWGQVAQNFADSADLNRKQRQVDELIDQINKLEEGTFARSDMEYKLEKLQKQLEKEGYRVKFIK